MQRVGPMKGDTPSRVVAQRIQPSGVASFGRVTHAPPDPRALCEAIRWSLLHQCRAAPGSLKWVPGWCGVGAVAVCVVQFLDKVVDVSVVVPGLLVGTVQLLDKAADVPVVVPRFVFEVFSQDGLSSVLLSRSSTRTG